jgi:hypothetical protein
MISLNLEWITMHKDFHPWNALKKEVNTFNTLIMLKQKVMKMKKRKA